MLKKFIVTNMMIIIMLTSHGDNNNYRHDHDDIDEKDMPTKAMTIPFIMQTNNREDITRNQFDP